MFGKTVSWNGQARDAQRLPWDTAFQGMWPQLAFGTIVMTLAYIGAPALFWWGLIMTLGYVVAIPFGVLLADPGLGRIMAGMRLCGIPEEFETPAEVKAVQA